MKSVRKVVVVMDHGRYTGRRKYAVGRRKANKLSRRLDLKIALEN